MNAMTLARDKYTQSAFSIKTPRRIEYDAFAKITHNLKECAKQRRRNYPAYITALQQNRKLWQVIAIDVADPENQLSADLRAKLFYLAEFTSNYTSQILSDKVSVKPLLEINVAVLNGLKDGSK